VATIDWFLSRTFHRYWRFIRNKMFHQQAIVFVLGTAWQSILSWRLIRVRFNLLLLIFDYRKDYDPRDCDQRVVFEWQNNSNHSMYFDVEHLSFIRPVQKYVTFRLNLEFNTRVSNLTTITQSMFSPWFSFRYFHFRVGYMYFKDIVYIVSKVMISKILSNEHRLCSCH